MGHVAYSSKNRLFEPVSGHFSPIRPTNLRRERNELPTLATVLPPPAPRPTSGVRLCADPPSPAGYRLPPTAEFPETGPGTISTSGPLYYSVCHRTRRFVRASQTIFPACADQPLTILTRSRVSSGSSERRRRAGRTGSGRPGPAPAARESTGAGEAAGEVPDGGRRCIPVMRTNDRAVRSGSCRENRQRLSK